MMKKTALPGRMHSRAGQFKTIAHLLTNDQSVFSEVPATQPALLDLDKAFATIRKGFWPSVFCIFVLFGFLVTLPGCSRNQHGKSSQSAPVADSELQAVVNQEGRSPNNDSKPDSGTESESVSEMDSTASSALRQNSWPQSDNSSQKADTTEETNLANSAPDSVAASLHAEETESHFEVSDEQTIEIPPTWKRLGKNEIWVDMQNRQVILGGYICVNAGALEMFACPAGTKEHESVVGVNAYASEMHAALLAVGAKPGAPCSWDEDSFTPASGSRIDIDLRWRDEATNETITRSAVQMMKTHDGEMPQIEWIFGGSRFYEDSETKTRYYMANSGEMICVSNFSTAAIDINMVSSQTNESLLFWANPDTTPARGTKVYLILTPGTFLKSEPQKYENQSADPAPSSNEGQDGRNTPNELKENPPTEKAETENGKK